LKRILAINTLIFGAGLALFSHESNYPLALVFCALTGFGMMSQVTVSNTLIQTTVDANMRGRVISFYAMAVFGMQPLGGLVIGSVSKWIGTPDTLLGEGIIAGLIGLLHMRFLRKEKLKRQQSMPALGQQTVQAV
jgi:MFS family permease